MFFPSPEGICRRVPTVIPDMNNRSTVMETFITVKTCIYNVCLMSLFTLCDQSFKGKFSIFLLIMTDKIHKKMQEISFGVNDGIVHLPLDLIEEASAENQFSLVAKQVNLRRQNLRALMTAFPRLWGVSDEVVGRLIEHHRVQFIFQTEDSMLSVLRRGPWSFNEWMCVIQRWSPEHMEDDLQDIAFWVQVRGIPCQYLSGRMVSHIGRVMFRFIETDFNNEGSSNLDYVRIRILASTATPLRFQRQFQFGSQTVTLRFRYEKLRGFCNQCGLMTHSASECPTEEDNNPHHGPEDDDDDADDDDPPPPGFPEKDHDEPTFPHAQETQHNHDTSSASASKKRKTEEPSSATATRVSCNTARQAFYVEDYEEHTARRERIQADYREAGSWVSQPDMFAASSSNPDPLSGHQHREGTVGQNPPEKE